VKKAKSRLSTTDAVKDATAIATMRIIDPLLDFIFDAGISIPELTFLIRERSVRAAARRTLKESGRISRSRVAIITGLPRSEVGRILRSPDYLPVPPRGQNPARRVLSGWYEDADYLAKRGEPAILPIFGKRRSFETLVSKYGGGIPVRAMLDELTLLDAVERLQNQKVRPRARLTVLTGVTNSAIAAVGERSRDLIETLTENVRNCSDPLFEATALVNDADEEMIALIRREITAQGSSFVNSIHSLLNRSRKARTSSSRKNVLPRRMGVTVFYFQDNLQSKRQIDPIVGTRRRKNLRRIDNASDDSKRVKKIQGRAKQKQMQHE